MKAFDKVWEQIHTDKAWGKYPNEDVVRFMARNFYHFDRTNVKVLDLGCGGGANSFFLAKEGFDTYAIDGSSIAIEKTRKYMQENGLSITCCKGDFISLPYESEFFDAVIDSGAIICGGTTSNIKIVVNECYRVLKPEGKILSTGLFTMKCTGAGTGEKVGVNTFRNEIEGSLRNTGTVHYFTKEEINDIYGSAGFNIVSIDTTYRTDFNGTVITEYYTTICIKMCTI